MATKVTFFKMDFPKSGRNGQYFAYVQVGNGMVAHQAVLPVGGEWEEFPGGVLYKWVNFEFTDGFVEVDESEVPKPLPEKFTKI